MSVQPPEVHSPPEVNSPPETRPPRDPRSVAARWLPALTVLPAYRTCHVPRGPGRRCRPLHDHGPGRDGIRPGRRAAGDHRACTRPLARCSPTSLSGRHGRSSWGRTRRSSRPMAASIIPLAGGDAGRSVALAAALALMVGAICIAAAAARLGFLTDLLSRPVRVGYMNGIALTVIVSQVPKLLGFSVSSSDFLGESIGIAQGVVGRPAWCRSRSLVGGGSLASSSSACGDVAAHPGHPGRGGPGHASSCIDLRARGSALGGRRRCRAASRRPGSRGQPRRSPRARPRRARDRPARLHRHERQLPDVQRPPRGVGRPGPRARRAGRVQRRLRAPRRLPDQQQRDAHAGRGVGRRQDPGRRASSGAGVVVLLLVAVPGLLDGPAVDGARGDRHHGGPEPVRPRRRAPPAPSPPVGVRPVDRQLPGRGGVRRPARDRDRGRPLAPRLHPPRLAAARRRPGPRARTTRVTTTSPGTRTPARSRVSCSTAGTRRSSSRTRTCSAIRARAVVRGVEPPVRWLVVVRRAGDRRRHDGRRGARRADHRPGARAASSSTSPR